LACTGIKSLFDWATVRGFWTGDNPASWNGQSAEVVPSNIAPVVNCANPKA
jgi:hypothetical protein